MNGCVSADVSSDLARQSVVYSDGAMVGAVSAGSMVAVHGKTERVSSLIVNLKSHLEP